MAIEHIGTAQNQAATYYTTVTGPAGMSGGDLAVAVVVAKHSYDTPSEISPSGWSVRATRVIGSTRVSIACKVVGSASDTSWSFYNSATPRPDYLMVTVSVYRGCVSTVPEDYSDTLYQVSDTTLKAESIDTVTDGDMLLFCGWAAGSGSAQSATAPSGFTERCDYYQDYGASDAIAYIADAIKATAGATGDKSAALQVSQSTNKHAFLFALGPPEPELEWEQVTPDPLTGYPYEFWYDVAMSGSGMIIVTSHHYSAHDSIFLSTDNGETWSVKALGSSYGRTPDVFAVSKDGSTIAALVSDQGVMLSADGGATFSALTPTGGAAQDWSCVALSSDGQVVLLGVSDGGAPSSGTLYRSDDGGSSWSTVKPGSYGVRAVGVSDDGDTVLAAEANGRVYVSTDGCANWSEVYPTGSPLNNYSYFAGVSGDGSVLVLQWNKGIYKSTDYGANWTDITPYTHGTNLGRQCSMSNDGDTIMFSEGTYVSVDGGTTWTALHLDGATTSNGPSAVNNDGTSIVVAEYGHEFWMVRNPCIAGVSSISVAMPQLSGVGTVSVTGTGSVSAAMPMLDGVGFRGSAGVVYGVGSVRAAMPTLDGVGGHLIPQEMALDQRLTKARLIQWLGKTKLYGG